MKKIVWLVIINTIYWFVVTFIVNLVGTYLLGQSDGYAANLKVIRGWCVALLVFPLLYILLRKDIMKVTKRYVIVQCILTLLFICVVLMFDL